MTKADESDGTTPTERLLFNLCRNSFLQLWSYANVFRDQGRRGEGDGKELCDILIVFGDNIILFSDKSCVFPCTGDLKVDWGRWYKRTILASQRQLLGAERWLRDFPNRVFIDRQCMKPLHVALPPTSRMRVFKIAVALGANERCRTHFGCSSGSFILTKPTPPGDPIPPNEPGSSPFVVPLCSVDGTIVHVADEVTLPILLKELDTISDFIAYLDSKEQLIRTRDALFIAGEEDLVGLFLGVGAGLADAMNTWAPQVCDQLIVAEGIYTDILNRPEYSSYVSENKISYFWDNLIAYHTEVLFKGTLVEGSMRSIEGNEAVLRILAQESRFNRRILSRAFLELVHNASTHEISSRTILHSQEMIYVFQTHPKMSHTTETYRQLRQEYLRQYCMLTAWRYRDRKRVVGIATGVSDPFRQGHDIAVLEIDKWTPEMLATGEELNRRMSTTVSRPRRRVELNTRFPRAWEPVDDTRMGAGVPKKRFKKRKPRQ